MHRLVANSAGAVGSGLVTVSGGGSFSFGGAGPIIGNNTITLTGPLTIDSIDAPIGANSNTLVINSNIASNTGGKLTIVGTAPASGTVNLQSLHLRSATFNVPAGTTLSTINQYSSLGQDTTGTNGNPDSGTLNIAGTGTFGDNDFNVSDNARGTDSRATPSITWWARTARAC